MLLLFFAYLFPLSVTPRNGFLLFLKRPPSSFTGLLADWIPQARRRMPGRGGLQNKLVRNYQLAASHRNGKDDGAGAIASAWMLQTKKNKLVSTINKPNFFIEFLPLWSIN